MAYEPSRYLLMPNLICGQLNLRINPVQITTIAEHNPDAVELPKAFDEPHEALHPCQISYADFGENAALKRNR